MQNFIKKFRKNKEMSQEALAERCGATKATISKLEKGEIQLTQAWMDKLARALDCKPWELIAESVHIDTVTKPLTNEENCSVDALMSLWKRSTPEVKAMFLTGIDAEIKKSPANGTHNGNKSASQR